MTDRERTALSNAYDVYVDAPFLTTDELIEKAKALNDWGVFSKRNIIQITRLPSWIVHREVSKSNRTGGRLDPDALPMIFDFSNSHDTELFKKILDETDTSFRFLCRLAGVPLSTMQYRTRDASADIR